MAFQCKHCGDHLIGSPSQEEIENVCDECYKEHFKSQCECTCTEHDMCSFCQNPPHYDEPYTEPDLSTYEVDAHEAYFN